MVFKIKKNKNYTVMSNYHLRDKNLSLKSKGLLSFMLSLPEDWDYSIRGLVNILKENKDSIKSGLDELKANGYLEMEKIKNEKGWFVFNYIIYETPDLSKEKSTESPCADFPYTDYPSLENPPQINTKEQIDKIDKSNLSKNHFITNYLIECGYIKKDELFIDLYNDIFVELYDSYEGKKIISATHYVVNKIIERDFIDENNMKIENRYAYLKKSIISNIEKLESFNDVNTEIDWVSDMYIDNFEY